MAIKPRKRFAARIILLIPHPSATISAVTTCMATRDILRGGSRYAELIPLKASEAKAMSDSAKVSMILAKGLGPSEQARLEQFDSEISEWFTSAGSSVRLCTADGNGGIRKLIFSEFDGKVVGTISAKDLLDAADPVSKIT